MYGHPDEGSSKNVSKAQKLNLMAKIVMPLLCAAFCSAFLVACIAHYEPLNEHTDYEIRYIEAESVIW